MNAALDHIDAPAIESPINTTESFHVVSVSDTGRASEQALYEAQNTRQVEASQYGGVSQSQSSSTAVYGSATGGTVYGVTSQGQVLTNSCNW